MKTTLDRREFLKTAVAGAGALAASALPGPLFAEDSPELNVGYLPITDAAPF